VKAAHVAGQCNLLLTNQKEKVLDQMSELSQIQEILVAKKAQVKSMETEAALMEVEVQKASLKMESVSELIENYTVSVISQMLNKHTE
jgi:predicted  nucleic acid-binding Zn-ribbon protein